MISEERAEKEILKLVQFYNQNKEKLQNISETDTRVKFIDRLFGALGWDIWGKKIPDEVLREESIKGRESRKKKADYTFRINGVTRLVVEAKAIKEDLNREKYIQQAIEYAYNKACSWAVLTDFEGVKIFFVDRESNYPFFDINLADLENFEQNFKTLWVLSKESILNNRLEDEAKRRGIKKRKVSINQQLYDDLRRWRKILSDDIRQRYGDKYDDYNIDEIVQRIIDRLIFIRKTEDSSLEDRRLDQLTRRFDKNKYEELKKIFEEYNKNYNSKLFGESSEDKHECDIITISNKVIETVIHGMYRPKGSKIEYNFDAIDADILGNIYERYLAYILKETPKRIQLRGGRAHRKEQGIYYTPTYVVDYIIRNTLGDLLKKGTDISKIKVLDPACGSGSFLIKAFDYLSNYYEKRLGKEKQTTLEGLKEGLFTRRAKILRNNIFGVDLDPKAVEIAQLNLLLKLAEKRHRLPTLKKNIRCGNSLIDNSDFSENPFKWDDEFEGEFDIVVGNPPYIRPHNLKTKDKEFFWKKFKTFKAKSDIYNCFMERGINLIKNGGLFSFIVPHSWTSLESFYEIRKYILNNCKIIKLVQLPKKVFQDATVETCIFVLSKESDEKKRDENSIIVERLNKNGEVSFVKKFKQSQIRNNHLYNFELYSESSNTLLNKIKKNGERLGNFIDFFYGLKTGDDKKFIFDSPKNNNCKKLLRSKNIGRYFKDFKNEYVWYIPKLMIQNKKTARPGDKDRFEAEKIIVARMGKQIMAVHDDERYYVKDCMLLLKKIEEINLRYITGILNSKLINHYYRNYFITIDVLKNALLELPIKIGNKETVSKISNLVDEIQKLNKAFLGLKNKKTEEKTKMEIKIKEMRNDIDNLVYNIYGIITNEKKIIKESFK